MTVHQLVYISAATNEMPASALAELLRKARANNTRAGITGLLIHHSGSFMQVLEGPESSVESLFHRIQADPRHRRVVVLGRESVKRATFPDWSMGLVDRASAQLASLPGFKDFSGREPDYADLAEVKTRASYLVEAFAVGRFRQFVTV